ncbi:MAG: hypothetical protein KF845_02480 [Cyclobacteriaceae bacterium]|nr:hypothetical protein [Cyclobacteriaceae bacterium]
MLRKNGFDINAEQTNSYDFVIQAAKGEFTFGQIKTWIKGHLTKINNPLGG